jgi:hypothetical protein
MRSQSIVIPSPAFAEPILHMRIGLQILWVCGVVFDLHPDLADERAQVFEHQAANLPKKASRRHNSNEWEPQRPHCNR